jgi:hypothetical protein
MKNMKGKGQEKITVQINQNELQDTIEGNVLQL